MTSTTNTSNIVVNDTQIQGLTATEVAQRIAAGKLNKLPPRTGKTVGDIIRSNVFTRINAILGVLCILVLITGSWINSAFGLLIIVNSAIGIVQELRARATLESLSLIGEEHPTVIRENKQQDIPQEELVLDDVIYLRAGKEIVVDGEVLATQHLSVDESMLTGESEPVVKNQGDEILSGSFVVAGVGAYRVTRVGEESYAAKIAAQAAKYELTKSKLQQGIDEILKYIVWILIPVGLLTILMQYRGGYQDWRSLILSITGALVPMVPEGLILITSTAFALGVIRLGKRNCLVNELPAIEGLARVSVVCADKTGTLTDNKLSLKGAFVPSSDASLASVAENFENNENGFCVNEKYRAILSQIAWSDPDPNMTVEAIREKFVLADGDSRQNWREVSRKPFSSANKWSGVSFAESANSDLGQNANTKQSNDPKQSSENYLLGAPDVLLQPLAAKLTDWLRLVESYENDGLRVLLLAEVDCAVEEYNAKSAAELGFKPLAVLVFEQTIRPDVEETLAFFNTQNVALKVISGDNLRSVSAVAGRLGIDISHGVDARTLDHENNLPEFTQKVQQGTVFGRVKPEQKQAMVHALQQNNETVAMTGDGVNDVLALKDADIGVAMGSGSSASRAVAKIVLLDNKFATLPYVVAEGRRVIGNIERVANLFLTKTTYSAVMAIMVIIAAVPFPFQPIHVTITGWFTIGIPAFILALPPNYRRAKDGFVRRILSFAMPSGVIVGVASFTTYLVAAGGKVPSEHIQESTAALATLIIASTWVLACVARPFNWWKCLLIVLPLVGYSIIFNWSFTQQIFLLDSTNRQMMWLAIVVGGISVALIELLWRLVRKRLS